MKVSEAATFWLNYHKSSSRRPTIRSYEHIAKKFCQKNGDKNLNDLTSDDILNFLSEITDGGKPHTKKTRYTQLKAFLNYAQSNIDPEFQNPCESPFLKKMFKVKTSTVWEIIEKGVVDEITFKISDPMDRLTLELMDDSIDCAH